MILTQLVGTLGRDAEHKQVNGSGLITFPVAIDQSYKKKDGERVSKTLWVDVNIWADAQGLLKVLKKGAVLFVSGEISARAFTSKDGELKASLSLKARDFKICKYAEDAVADEEFAGAEAASNDGLPF
jgi:single-strand DNA-binding protein